MLGQPLLSIIVPVYNRETYLRRCLESLMNQTMEEIEVLVIDDGSTDQTPQILDEFQQANPDRIRSFRTENRGPAEARNYGMKNAKGKYITFVDSDDYVEKDAYEKICNMALEENADVICAPAYRWEDEECQIIGYCPEEERDKTSIIYYTTGSLWNKLFRKEFLKEKGLKVPDLVISEDLSFVMAAMTWAEKLCYVDYAYYHYELSENSLSLASRERPWIVELVRKQKDWLLAHINNAYNEVIREVLQKQFLYCYQNNYKFQDQLWTYLRQEQSFYLNEGRDNILFPNPGRQLRELLLSADHLIPQIVYLNGFDPTFDVNRQAEEVKNSLFVEPCEVRILNQKNCTWEKDSWVQDTLEQENYALAGAYYAMKSILSSGGIYLGNRIQILDKWNGMRVNRAFFGLDAFDAVSLQLFGGAANNLIMETILASWMEEDQSVSGFQEFLKKKLLEKCEDSMESDEREKAYENTSINDKDVRVYKAGVFVLPEYGIMSLSIYSDYYLETEAELRQCLFLRTRRVWKERKAQDTELAYTKNKAYQNTLWQQKQRKNLQKKLDQQQVQQELLHERLDKAGQDLSWLQGQRTHLQKRVEKLSRDLNWQQDQRQRVQEKFNKTHQDLTWMQNQRDNLQKKLDEINLKLEWTQNQKDNLQKKFDETSQRLEWEQEQKISIQEELNEAKVSLQSQIDENEYLEKKCGEITREKENLERSYSYRVGCMVTWIPRWIRRMLKG